MQRSLGTLSNVFFRFCDRLLTTSPLLSSRPSPSSHFSFSALPFLPFSGFFSCCYGSYVAPSLCLSFLPVLSASLFSQPLFRLAPAVHLPRWPAGCLSPFLASARRLIARSMLADFQPSTGVGGGAAASQFMLHSLWTGLFRGFFWSGIASVCVCVCVCVSVID